MDSLLLLISIFFCLWVMWRRRIPLVSFYMLFALQWAFYWVFPYFISLNILDPQKYLQVPPLLLDPTCAFYFFVFNAISMIIFSAVYLLFYRTTEKEKNTTIGVNIYAKPLLLGLIVLAGLITVLSIKFPYLAERGTMYSVIGNLRTIFSGLFIFYMVCERDTKNTIFVYLLFCIATFIYGSRINLLIVSVALMLYLYNSGKIQFKHALALFALIVLVMSGTVLFRSGMIFNIGNLLFPFYGESMLGSYSLFQVVDLWQQGAVNYYTYFANYIIDPIMSFVPQTLFISNAVDKYYFNILGGWRDAHGGNIAPYGAFHYLAEAFIAFSYYGIFIISFLYAYVAVVLERQARSNGLLSLFLYYNYVGVFGAAFIKNEFFLVGKNFLMNLIFVLLAIAVINMISRAARKT